MNNAVRERREQEAEKANGSGKIRAVSGEVTMRQLLAASVAAFAVFTFDISVAQDWPTRPVTMVVPYTAGGPVDTLSRVLAARLGDVLGQQVIVENVGGAGGMTGSSRVAKAAPDGYTFLMAGTSTMAMNQTLYKHPLYDAAKDFTSVTLVTDSARVLILRKDFPANTFSEFVNYAKANWSKMQYGSAGAGSGTHVCAILLDAAMGTKITHVPYRGSAQAMQDMIGGRIDFIAEQISTALPQIESKNVKALVTLGLDRAPGLENLPTAKEEGMDGLDCGSWGAFMFPKGTPDAIVQRMAKAANDTVETPAVRDRLRDIGVTIPAKERRTVEYLQKFIPSEIERWVGPIKAAGVSAD
jgi:tripartite-type tricarboxylate transporter receptor subunit TctC